jgi:glycogen synthase
MSDKAGHETQPCLRILMTADAIGGVWQYSAGLAAELAVHGIQITLATLGPRPSNEQRQQVQAIPGLTLFESDYKLEWMQEPWRDVDASGQWLLQLASDSGADLVHLNGYSHAALPWKAPALVVAHSCVSSWWRAVHGCAPGPEWNEYRLRVAAGLAASSLVIAPSRYMAEALAAEYGISSTGVRVVHNFSRVPPASASAKQPFCFAAGRFWDAAKNLGILSAIARRLDWPIRVAGDNRSPEGDVSPSADLHFLGRLSNADLLRHMRAASIFVHPALYEPFGLSVLDAALSGCRLVLSDIGSLRELWGGAAVFVNPRDPDQWIYELTRLTRDPLTRQTLSGRAVARAANYRPAPAAAQYLDIYRSLIRTRKTSANEAAA